MTTQASSSSRWTQLPVWLRAILAGLLIALPAANLWPVLLLSLGVPLAAVLEVVQQIGEAPFRGIRSRKHDQQAAA